MDPLIGVYDKWPDFVEVYGDPDDPTTHKVVFVIIRRNSRRLNDDQVKMIRTLENLGLTVRVRVGTVDLTLEQFDEGGSYDPLKRVPGRQEIYNVRSELKQNLSLRETMTEEDPRLPLINRRITHLRALLETAEPTVDLDALKRSDEGLNKLIPMLLSQLSDEELAGMTIDELEKFKIPKNTPTWIALIDRRALAQKQLKEKTQNAQQSVVTDTNHTRQEHGEGEPILHQPDVDYESGRSSPDSPPHVVIKPTEGNGK